MKVNYCNTPETVLEICFRTVASEFILKYQSSLVFDYSKPQMIPQILYQNNHHTQAVFVCVLLTLYMFLTFSGSSSSALGLQSLGLSGQAPSSSSLDAGTLSDTTASGNKTTSVVV